MTEAALELNQIIRGSEEYHRYQQAVKAVKEETELYQAMNTFRRRNYELQSRDDGVNRYHEIHNLSVEFEHILSNPLVNEFLVAEQILSRKLQQIYEVIADGLELDYDYME
ncbi:MAG: YlbF family regulator [Lachnospiraceae bacterium]|nr:YlbF family regulator [Lachnospiraceae bacterium]